MEKSIFNRIAAFLLVFSLLPIFEVHSNASCYATQFEVLPSNGWQWNQNEDQEHAHMGQKNTTYYYDYHNLHTYETFINEGIAEWGSSISCTYVSNPNNAVGTINTTIDSHGNESFQCALAFARVEADSVSKHIYEWTITLCLNEFSQASDEEKILTIAHEIGHAYGLAHVGNQNNIMFTHISDDLSVTAADLVGMNVMTHSHIHGGYTYNKLASMRHKQTCGGCGGYMEVSCSVTSSWHSGTKHYYEYDCPCGNYKLDSKNCNGNCIDIMEHDDSEAE